MPGIIPNTALAACDSDKAYDATSPEVCAATSDLIRVMNIFCAQRLDEFPLCKDFRDDLVLLLQGNKYEEQFCAGSELAHDVLHTYNVRKQHVCNAVERLVAALARCCFKGLYGIHIASGFPGLVAYDLDGMDSDRLAACKLCNDFLEDLMALLESAKYTEQLCDEAELRTQMNYKE